MLEKKSSVLVAVVALVAAAATAQAANRFDIEPGPLEITPAERAIVADPERGIEHAVILVNETLRDEERSTDYLTLHHFRAKILSNEARDLANIEIPFDERGRISEWWARTLLPDGTVLEVGKDELQEQSLVEARGLSISSKKAALPGVVPGCVIDYGYRITQPGYDPFDRIPIQGPWPTLSFRFVWIPYSLLQSAYRVKRAEHLDVGVDVDKRRVLIEGRNLPAVREEPLMPPYNEVSASVYVYYMPPGSNFGKYWKDTAERYERLVKRSYKKASAEQMLARIEFPADGLSDRLKAIYDWLGANVKRSSLLSFEELREDDDESKERQDAVREILETDQGTSWELCVAFLALARQIGADAFIVLASDRTERYWDEALRSTHQFDYRFVAVGPPGTPSERLTIVDPGSGLEYGHLPWWVAGNHGFVARPKDPGAVPLLGAEAEANRSTARVEIRFEEDNELSVFDWEVDGSGQVGLLERRYLRSLSPRERTERIDQLCGASSRTEVVAADVAGLDDVSVPFKLSCETESPTDLTESIGLYQFSWTGPWVDALPDLPDGPREHSILFRYPHVDVALVTIDAPAGFEPKEAPPPVTLPGPATGYMLEFQKTETGYVLKRQLMKRGIGLRKEDYPAFREFVEQVRQADRKPLTFVRSREGS